MEMLHSTDLDIIRLPPSGPRTSLEPYQVPTGPSPPKDNPENEASKEPVTSTLPQGTTRDAALQSWIICQDNECSCGAKFTKPGQLTRHIAMVKVLFPCHSCSNKCFGSKNDLRRHIREVHGELDDTSFPCPSVECDRHDRPFPRRSNLLAHLRKRHGLEPDKSDEYLQEVTNRSVSTLSDDFPCQRGRRIAPLNTAQRERAALMRAVGACDDCKRQKKKCDPSHKDRPRTSNDLQGTLSPSPSPSPVRSTARIEAYRTSSQELQWSWPPEESSKRPRLNPPDPDTSDTTAESSSSTLWEVDFAKLTHSSSTKRAPPSQELLEPLVEGRSEPSSVLHGVTRASNGPPGPAETLEDLARLRKDRDATLTDFQQQLARIRDNYRTRLEKLEQQITELEHYLVVYRRYTAR